MHYHSDRVQNLCRVLRIREGFAGLSTYLISLKIAITLSNLNNTMGFYRLNLLLETVLEFYSINMMAV